MKHCYVCGAKTLDDDALYCTECGSPLGLKDVVTVRKGEKVALKKFHTDLDDIVVDLQWRCAPEIDIDSAAFLLGSNGKVCAEDDFVFYNNPKHRSECVEHFRLRADREQIKVTLSKVPYPIFKITFSLTINDAEVRRQNFSRVQGIVLRIVDAKLHRELIRYAPNDFRFETAIILGEIYLHKSQWKFHAIGAGFEGGLAALCRNFGVEVD